MRRVGLRFLPRVLENVRSSFHSSFFGAGAARRFQSSAAKAGDDDFVEIDTLAMSSLSCAVSGSATSSAPADEPAVLGVTRRVELAEGTELSRFDIPLETPRHGEPIPRPDSRGAFKPGEEARLVAEHLQSAATGKLTNAAADNSKEDEAVDVAVVLADAIREDKETAAVGSAGGSLLPPPDTTLPYDDSEFAETLLQMEVDGVIDEAWQDTRKAHLEDVKEVAAILRSLKVRDICCVDVAGKTGNFDYMVFGTCEGPRHIHLAAWAAQEADSLKRVSKIPRKKTDELWEVVPIGRIVLNLMVESLRDELTLERKWAVTKTMDPLETANAPASEGRNVRAHGLWTLTLNLQDLEDFEVDYCKDVLLRQM